MRGVFRHEFRHVAAAAADIEHTCAGFHGAQRKRVAGAVAELQVVGFLHCAHVELPVVEQIFAVQRRADHRLEAIPRILEAVHVAHLVAVVRGDGDFRDAQPGVMELHDDVRVEVKIVRVSLKRDVLQRLHGVEPVAAVKLAQRRAEHDVLVTREHLVADPFIHRHPARERVLLFDHPRAKHRIRLTFNQRLDQRGQLLRRILAVAVDERHDVKSVVDRVTVAELLIPAIALIHRVSQRHDPQVVAVGLVLDPLRKRLIFRRIVDNEHLDTAVAQRCRDAVEHTADGLLRVIRDDENEDALLRKVDGVGHDWAGLL